MNPSTQSKLISRLIAMAQGEKGEIPVTQTTIDTARYQDQQQHGREIEKLFKTSPLIVAHLSEIPQPGDFITEDIGGIPLIILRDQQGEVHVLVNACRHRGARLLNEESGKCKRVMTCPYHAWSYLLDGTLNRIVNEEVFADIDKSNLGLKAIDFEIRYGFIWAYLSPKSGDKCIGDYLGPDIDEDFVGFDFENQYVLNKVISTNQCNWKLVMDAFAEGYHLQSLHRDSLSRFFLKGSIFDNFSPHVRQLGGRKTLLDVVDKPEQWDFRRDTTLFYNIFPNTVFVFHPLWVSLMTLIPLEAGQVKVVHRMLVEKLPDNDEEAKQLEKSFEHIHGQVFEKEDLAISENIQTTLASGANTEFILGGLEEGTRIFHEARDKALEQ